MTNLGNTNAGANAASAYVKIRSGNQNDTVRGESHYGTLDIATGGGNDITTITGIGGLALIHNAAGDDTNYIFNMFANNKVNNGKGDDTNYIFTEFCNNTINNGKGNDYNVLSGYGNINKVDNGKGNDTNIITGSGNVNTINNGKGHDYNVVEGSNNTNKIDMGKGNDTTVIKAGGQGNVTTVSGGKGNDTVILEGNYQFSNMVFENGKMYRVFRDDQGNVAKIAHDVENIQVQPGYQQPPQPVVPPPPPPMPQQGVNPVQIPLPPQPEVPPMPQGGSNFLQDLASWFFAALNAILNPPPPPPVVAANEVGTVTGDPHFKGGDGGKYDVQGQPGKIYNILSDSGLQLNARFDAWGGGGATVVGETGLTVAGPYGQSSVTFSKDGTAKVNGQVLQDGQTVQLADGGTATKQGNKLVIKTAEGYEITQTTHGSSNGNYINMEVKTGAGGVAQDGVLPGGLLGQTFDPDNVARNGAKGAGAQGEGAINGTVQDYEVPSLTPMPQPYPPQPYPPMPYPPMPYPPMPPMPPMPPPPPPMTANMAIQTLINNMDIADTAAGVGRTDNIIGKNDLEALANSPNIDPQLKAAAQYMLNNPAVFNTLDDAAKRRGSNDGLIGLNDLQAALNNGTFNNFDPPPGFNPNNMTMGDAAKILLQNKDFFDRAAGIGGHDGIIGKADLEAAANSQDLPPHVRMAAQYLLQNEAVFNAIDVAKGRGTFWGWFTGADRPDGKISTGDLEKFLERHPASF